MPSPACPPVSFSRKPASAWAVWGIAAAAFLLAAFCLASLSFDGSYYLLRTLQEGPMVPHRRWLNHLLLAPVLWARPLAGSPAGLAVWHGLSCAVVPLLSLAACLGILRGRLAPLRLWAVLGILIAPLPGQIVLVGEVTPALQAGWVGLAFVWAGCPWRWAPAAVLAGAAAWGLHPVAVPMALLAAATAALLATTATGSDRWRFLGWAALFALMAAGKSAETALLATPYERANLHGAAWRAEAIIGLTMTPFLAILPVLAQTALAFLARWRNRPLPRDASRVLWAVAFLAGLALSLHPLGWTGGLCYRKFGIVVAAFFALMAGAEAWRLCRAPEESPWGAGRSILLPALLFAVILGGMSLSWRGLCRSFAEKLNASPGKVQTPGLLSPVERDSALNHWSTTSLSLLLQGWSPTKVYVWDAAQQQTAHGLQICPGDAFNWTDGTLKLGRLTRLESSAAGE